jgi:hypothetical protein
VQYNDGDALRLFSQLKDVATFNDAANGMTAANLILGILNKNPLVGVGLALIQQDIARGTDQFARDYENFGNQEGLLVLVDEVDYMSGGTAYLADMTYRIYLKKNKAFIGSYNVHTWFDGAGNRVGELRNQKRLYQGQPAAGPACAN